MPVDGTVNADAGLAVRCVELGRLLIEKKKMRLRASGRCMYPCIRSGDALQVRACTLADIVVGDVAVYRRNDRLFAHRVIRKGVNADGAFMVTRPDTALSGDDGMTFDRDVLGVVESLERGGVRLDARPRAYPLVQRGGHALYMAWHQALDGVRGWLVRFVFALQRRGFYRYLADIVFWRARLDYAVETPLSPASTSGLRRVERLADAVRRIRLSEGADRWELILKVNGCRAGRAALVRSVPGAIAGVWRLEEFNLWQRYRGTRIEARFRKMILDTAKQIGVKEV
jgi:hypothetical protein